MRDLNAINAAGDTTVGPDDIVYSMLKNLSEVVKYTLFKT